MNDDRIAPIEVRSLSSWRNGLAGALPGVVAGLGFFWLFDDQSGLSRAFYGLAGALLFPLIVMIGLLTVSYFVESVAGQHHRAFDWRDAYVRGGMTLIVFVWFLGHGWVRSTERDFVRCIHDRAEVSTFAQSPADVDDIADYCRNQLHQSSVPDDGD